MNPKQSTNNESQEDPKEALERCVQRISGPKEHEYFRSLFHELITNNSIPIELLDHIPKRAFDAEKTRFDQIYDAALYLVFPRYRHETLEKLVGPRAEEKPKTKIWRVMIPKKFGISHVLIRAESFQEAFALGCDYVCRISLRLCGKIPTDLTIRVQFVSEKALRRFLDMRWANRVKKRKQLQLVGREFSPKELTGARLAALGNPRQPQYSIAKYAENKDLKRLLSKKNIVRESSIEVETFRKD